MNLKLFKENLPNTPTVESSWLTKTLQNHINHQRQIRNLSVADEANYATSMRAMYSLDESIASLDDSIKRIALASLTILPTLYLTSVAVVSVVSVVSAQPVLCSMSALAISAVAAANYLEDVSNLNLIWNAC
jgi:hypothetical protein